jgi:hypothetical protein
MNIGLPTKAQWKSILKNTVIAFVSGFLYALTVSPEINKAALKGAGVAGVMAIIKLIEKLVTEPKLS